MLHVRMSCFTWISMLLLAVLLAGGCRESAQETQEAPDAQADQGGPRLMALPVVWAATGDLRQVPRVEVWLTDGLLNLRASHPQLIGGRWQQTEAEDRAPFVALDQVLQAWFEHGEHQEVSNIQVSRQPLELDLDEDLSYRQAAEVLMLVVDTTEAATGRPHQRMPPDVRPFIHLLLGAADDRALPLLIPVGPSLPSKAPAPEEKSSVGMISPISNHGPNGDMLAFKAKSAFMDEIAVGDSFIVPDGGNGSTSIVKCVFVAPPIIFCRMQSGTMPEIGSPVATLKN